MAKKELTDAEKAKKKAERKQKFKELADKRVPLALNKIANIGRLANKKSYEYSAAQANRIIEALTAATKDVYNAFQGKAISESSFTVGD